MDHNEINLEKQHSEREILDLEPIRLMTDKIRNEIHKVIVGQDEMITLILAGLYCGGHVLLEGVPGIAKTMVVNLLSKTMDLNFKRIQFTPDLMPADVTGTSVFNMKTSEFEFRHGPVFSNLVLIDEINRSPAKTQAALFEVMEEMQVTIDGQSHQIQGPFMVLATQNPIEQEGTYKLPEAQQDRFLFKIKVEYPTQDQEFEILRRFESDFNIDRMKEVNKVVNPMELENCRRLIQKVHVKEDLLRYIAAVITLTRKTGDLFLGASPRASLAIVKTSKALAAMQGRDFVTPDDIHHAAYPVLNHRLVLSPEREMEGVEIKDVIDEIFKKVEIPR